MKAWTADNQLLRTGDGTTEYNFGLKKKKTNHVRL